MRNEGKETILYMYRLTSDTGLAPCVDNGLWTLAVCKGGQIRNGKPCNAGLRHKIGSEDQYKSKNIYVLGTYHNKFLYLARVTEVISMEEYFRTRSKGRTDNIYSFKNGSLDRNDFLRKDKIHTEADRIIKDLAGQYVLISDDFIYLGRDAADIDIVKQYNPNFQETKTYTGKTAEAIIQACESYRDDEKHLPHDPFETKTDSKKCGGCK